MHYTLSTYSPVGEEGEVEDETWSASVVEWWTVGERQAEGRWSDESVAFV